MEIISVDIEPLGLKFIHLEINKNVKNIPSMGLETYYLVSHTCEPKSKIINGLHFRWVVRFLNKEETFIHCIAEEIFISKNLYQINGEGVRKIIEYSFRKFNEALRLKLLEKGIDGNVCYTVKDKDIFNVLQKCRERQLPD